MTREPAPDWLVEYFIKCLEARGCHVDRRPVEEQVMSDINYLSDPSHFKRLTR